MADLYPQSLGHAMSPFIDLPLELTLNILERLDFRSLLACKMVCSSLHTLITSSAELQYKIELGAAGCEDGPPSTITKGDRLQMLIKREAAWNKLQWTSGTAIHSLNMDDTEKLYGGVLGWLASDKNLIFTRLPSEIKGLPALRWECQVDFAIYDFAMFPDQDLLVMIETPNENDMGYHMHLRALSTAEPHSKSLRSTLVVPLYEETEYRFEIHVCGEHLSVLSADFGPEFAKRLLVWNWQEGTEKATIHGTYLDSFSFLTHQHILVAIDMPEVPTSHLDGKVSPAFLVLDVTKQPARSINIREVEYECAFEIPKLERETDIYVCFCSDPAPTRALNEYSKVPFHVSPEDRLFVCLLDFDRTSLSMFVPSSTFLSHLSALDATQKGRRFAWDEWGPTGSRVLSLLTEHSAERDQCSGLSFVSPYRGDDLVNNPGDFDSVRVFDFNQLAIRRALTSGEEKDESCTTSIVTEENVVAIPDVFEHPIRTSLPYRLRSKSLKHAFDTVMLSEDAIVTIVEAPVVEGCRVFSF